MILPTAADFEYVTGLESIRTNVDVIHNRTGVNQRKLWGKDMAVMMEHSGVRKHLLDGMTVRGAYTLTPVVESGESAREFPALFNRRVLASETWKYAAVKHVFEYFKDNDYPSKPTSTTLRYCKQPNSFVFEFGECPIEDEELNKYVGPTILPGYKLLMQDMKDWETDMKKQQYAYATLNWCYITGLLDDYLVLYDKQGDGGPSHSSMYSYACDEDGSSWLILGEKAGQNFNITFPTKHITGAWLLLGMDSFTTYHRYNDESGYAHTDEHTIPGFWYRIATTWGEKLTINQESIVWAIRYAIESSGNTFYNKDNVTPAGYKNGRYWFAPYKPTLMVVFFLDDHTKWW